MITEKDREDYAQLMRLRTALLTLCQGQDTAVAGLAVLYAAIALRQADTGATWNEAISLLRAQLADMLVGAGEPS